MAAKSHNGATEMKSKCKEKCGKMSGWVARGTIGAHTDIVVEFQVPMLTDRLGPPHTHTHSTDLGVFSNKEMMAFYGAVTFGPPLQRE